MAKAKDVLALGLSFAIAPRHIPQEEIISATEAMARRLDHKSADTLRLGVSAALRKAKPPKANLSTQQRKALHTLQDDPNIVIVPADKGKATVVMDKADYTRRMMLTLEDEKYSPLRRDQTVKVENKFASILKRLCREGHIDEKLCDLLTPRYSSAPQMYGPAQGTQGWHSHETNSVCHWVSVLQACQGAGPGFSPL